MTRRDLIQAGQEVLAMLDSYHGQLTKPEEAADRILFAYLQGAVGHMVRQHHVRFRGRRTPERIDFRYGTSNPVVIELAIRSPRDGRAKLYALTNRSELRKLTRIPPRTARMRALLLLDRSRDSIPVDVLKRAYDALNAGRGNFKRHYVSVIYVSGNDASYFRWDPWASK